MLIRDGLVDHGVALGVERDGADGRPVSGGGRPTRRVAPPSLEVEGVASSNWGQTTVVIE